MLIAAIEESGVPTFEPVTPAGVDRSIAFAALTYCEREFGYRSGPMPEFSHGTPRWDAIVYDALDHVGIDGDIDAIVAVVK